jgi:hypothetical protein
MRRLDLPTALFFGLAILVIAEAMVYAMGHPFFCPCGTKRLWYGLRGGPEESQQFTDWYTYSHVLHGFILYWLLWLVARGRLSIAARLVIAATIEGAWEVIENTPLIIGRYRTQTVSHDYFGDTILNSSGDILAMFVGFLIAARLPAWLTVALLVGTELGMLYLIRDNLTLNTIMLLHPLEGVRQWQAGG